MASPGNINNALTGPLSTVLQSRYGLIVSSEWLDAFLAAQRTPLPPLPALTSTAHFRLLNSDFTVSLSRTPPAASLLPPDVGDASIRQRRLTGDVPVQLLDIQDIGSSKWSQAEAIERVERGEEVRGREVIRTLPTDVGEGEGERSGPASAPATAAATAAASGAAKSMGPHRLILQDGAGTKLVAFEKIKIPGLAVGEDGVQMGAKFLVKRSALVRRGILMLEPGTVDFLGGKVDLWHRQWTEGQKQRLRNAVLRQGGSD